MYFLLPIGHEESDVRRLPWVTIAIVVLCVAVHWLFMEPAQKRYAESLTKLQATLEYYFTHPDLRLDPELAQEMRSFGIDPETGEWLGDEAGARLAGGQLVGSQLVGSHRIGSRTVRGQVYEEPEEEVGYADPRMMEIGPEDDASESASEPAAPQRDLAAEQKVLDRLFADYQASKNAAGERPGLIPSDFEIGDLFASIFLHADWWHLLSNLLILWLCGPALEDIWGRPFFAVFFLLAGAVSGLAWMFLNLGGNIPMVGASGAIAGLMGAFALRFWHNRIQFFYAYIWLLPPKAGSGTFGAPAWIALGLWFGREVLSLTLVEMTGTLAGVAFAAHVGGFAMGAASAFAMKRMRIEEIHLAPAIEKTLTRDLGGMSNAGLAKAIALADGGRDEEALRLLHEALQARPNDPDSASALWDLSGKMGRRKQAWPLIQRQLKLELRGGDRQLALQRWEEYAHQVPPELADVELRWRLADAFLADGAREAAREVLDVLTPEMWVKAQAGLKLQMLKTALESESRLLLPLAEHCVTLPYLPDNVRAQVTEVVARAKALEMQRRRLAQVEIIPFADPRPVAPVNPF